MSSVRWSQWGDRGMICRGIMPKREMQSELQRFEARAKELLEETGADHVLYGRKFYNEAGELEELRFYLLPMSEETFEKEVAPLRNQQVYALHKMK